MTLILLICILFPAAKATAGNKIVDLGGQIHAPDFSKAVPGQLNYQGFLVSAADSSTVTAALEMTFRLFDSETKGAELWAETHPTVEVQGGLFQVLLGSLTPFPEGLFEGATLWLQTEVGIEILLPRKPLVSTAYSQHAQTSEHALAADWAADADHAFHADTAAYSPSAAVWTLSGDDIYRETGNVGIGTPTPTQKLHVVGDIYCTGKLTSDGGNDPPYVLYNKESREAIIDRIAEEVPEDKQDGAVLFWNGDEKRLEVYLPEDGEFRDLQGHLLMKVSELHAQL